MELEYIQHAVNNPLNHIETTSDERQRKIVNVIDRLPINDKISLNKKLQNYRLIEGLDDIREGRYTRWISMQNPSKLMIGGILVEMRIGDTMDLVCKNRNGMMFQCRMDECLIFQKLTDQEMVLQAAMDLVSQ